MMKPSLRCLRCRIWTSTPNSPGETNDPTGHISYRLAVAKQDIEANTEIDDPDKFFKVDNFPVAPEKAIAADAHGFA